MYKNIKKNLTYTFLILICSFLRKIRNEDVFNFNRKVFNILNFKVLKYKTGKVF